MYLSYLVLEVLLVAVGIAGGTVGNGQVIVAVVDDTVVVTGYIVLVGIVLTQHVAVEVGQVLEVNRGILVDIDHVGTYLTKQVGTYGNGLELVEDAQQRSNGVGRGGQLMTLGVDDVLVTLVEHVAAGGSHAGHRTRHCY